jgi:hypothetical protein
MDSNTYNLEFAACRIAALLPCYNKEAAIAQTIAGFSAALPEPQIYVYDNNSRDQTRSGVAHPLVGSEWGRAEGVSA